MMANNFFPPLPDDPFVSLTASGSSNASLTSAEPQPPGSQGITSVDVDARRTLDNLQLTSSRLKSGTWLFTYNKSSDGVVDGASSIPVDGTFRFDVPDGGSGVRGSGDMYKRAMVLNADPGAPGQSRESVLAPGPAPPNDQGIPIFPIDQYEGYLRVTNISANLLGDNGFDLEFAKYKWNVDTKAFSTSSSGRALIEETYTIRLTWSNPSSPWPSSSDYLTGELKIKSTGMPAGKLSMGYVSSKYRRISVEIDAVRGCTFPEFNTARKSIWNLLEAAGFELSRGIADENSVDDTASGQWHDAELHAAMLNHRQKVDLDKEWMYHAFMIPKYEVEDVLGIMYDDIATRTDINRVAREGFAVVARLPTGDAANWGTEAGRLLQEAKDSFVRTTIHELSHAMGMQHPNAYSPEETMDDTYTCQTWSLTQHAQEQGLIYPSNIQWRHSPVIQKRLRHYPDIRVRPGGVSFSAMGGVNGRAPWVPPNDVAPNVLGLTMNVESLINEVPFGAPVRVRVTLHNNSKFALEIPRNIGLSGQALKGDVMDTGGLRRPFQPLVHCADMIQPLSQLPSGKSITTDVTLFAGAQGPLFPSMGVHTVTMILSWNPSNGQGYTATVWLSASTTVMVTGPQSASHAAAAHRLLAEPQTQLCLVLAGDHLQDGVKSIQQACEDEVLGPHYAGIEARRCAKSFMNRKPDIKRARELIGRENTVMSGTEKAKMDRLCGTGV